MPPPPPWRACGPRAPSAGAVIVYDLAEATGISEPAPVARTLDFRDEAGRSLADVSPASEPR